MSTRPVPTANFTTTGDVRLSKHAAGIDQTFFALECRLTPGSAAISHALPVDLPAWAQVEHIHVHPFAASTIVTGTSVGFGVTGDPDEYMEIAENDIDAVGENITTIATAVAPSAGKKALFLHSTNGSGAGAGTIIGDWGIRITGIIVNPIATA